MWVVVVSLKKIYLIQYLSCTIVVLYVISLMLFNLRSTFCLIFCVFIFITILLYAFYNFFVWFSLFFFFQAEDGIRDLYVTGVQTCALPISFPELCGTGVVYKLGQALFGVDSEIPRRHLDLVALATIADVVPLVDENRSFAIAGLRALARTAKPGLRALMQSAGVDAAAVDAGAVGFRLAPRLNAAGRLGHPREALELLLTEDETEARRLAASLEELNRERQAVEARILREAVAQVEEWPT